jgi:hypothetical protein
LQCIFIHIHFHLLLPTTSETEKEWWIAPRHAKAGVVPRQNPLEQLEPLQVEKVRSLTML